MNPEAVQAVTEEVLKRLGLEGTVTIKEGEANMLVSIETPDSALLIGRGGETLDALQAIIRLLSQKGERFGPPLTLDINGYRKQREEELIWFVKETATRVTETGQSETLRPMTSYERRLVHQIVEEMGLSSESTGEGTERRIVIRPRES